VDLLDLIVYDTLRVCHVRWTNFCVHDFNLENLFPGFNLECEVIHPDKLATFLNHRLLSEDLLVIHSKQHSELFNDWQAICLMHMDCE
jgi:hypothetical protein